MPSSRGVWFLRICCEPGLVCVRSCAEDLMQFPRRHILRLAAVAAALPLATRIASAQAYPARPVRIVVTTAPGSAADIHARLLGQWLSERLGQSFIIENRPGAGNNIGTEAVIRSRPDGYTLLHVTAAAAINATLYDKLSFNFIRDIAPVASLVNVANVMTVHPSFPASSVPEFISYAKTHPGTINTGGNPGGAGHLSSELFKMMAGASILYIPYRGEALALTDLLAGQLHGRLRDAAWLDRICQVGSSARPGGDDRGAQQGTAGRSHDWRVRAGLRVEWLAGHWCAQGHAARDHRAAQQGDQCGACRPEDCGAHRRARRQRFVRIAGRFRQARRRRNREMGQGDPRRQHQAGVSGWTHSEESAAPVHRYYSGSRSRTERRRGTTQSSSIATRLSVCLKYR